MTEQHSGPASFSKWIWPLMSILVMVFVLSLRLLSDPDLGTHLKAGRYIVENRSVPVKDTFTYTVAGSEYIDVHWLFQTGAYLLYRWTGYEGLSLAVTFLALLLFCLLLFRDRLSGVPTWISCLVLLPAFLIIEQRFMPRPEMVTWIFITLLLLVLDRYYRDHKNHLYLLPVIMLPWCNIQGLFILGPVIMGAYFLSLLIRDRRIDLTFLLFAFLGVLACLVNPYFIRGLIFPLELFSLFDPQNIYQQHIKELTPFYRLDHLFFRDYLFLGYSACVLVLSALTIRKRKPHEIVLLALFLYLAIVAIRNVPLFIVISFPVLTASLSDTVLIVSRSRSEPGTVTHNGILKNILFWLLLLLPLLLIPRVITNAYYVSSNSYNRTGLGLDPGHQPAGAAGYIRSRHLEGRILNSIAFGGWLSWSLSQPVFIDGRLEIMKESLYRELVGSWKGGLAELTGKYQPDLIVYNYVTYYPWTDQLADNPEWRMIYADGFAVIYARTGYSPSIPAFDPLFLPVRYGFSPALPDDRETAILKQEIPSSLLSWSESFYRKHDDRITWFQNLGSLCLQLARPDVAKRFLLESLNCSGGRNTSVYYALADIYREEGNLEKAEICYRQILSFDPENPVAFDALHSPGRGIRPGQGTSAEGEAEARTYFNSGNRKYQYGDIEGAIADYTRAIGIWPGYYKAYNNRGIARAVGLKNFEEALGDFNKAIELRPDYADAWLGRGTARYNLKDFQGACSDWQKARSLGNRQADEMILLHCGR
jgi:tetratricopeptide (TPR) repeat protein